MGDKTGNKSLSRTTPVFTINYHISSAGGAGVFDGDARVKLGKVADETNVKHLRDALAAGQGAEH